MNQQLIAWPFLAMMLLTLVVWVVMFRRRAGYMKAERLHPEKFKTPEQVAALIPAEVNAAANNLKNLFELPVLFYALCLYLLVSGSVDVFYLACAWFFVLARSAHSFVHCGSNHVLTRFRCYALASIALWLMLLRCVWQLIAASF